MPWYCLFCKGGQEQNVVRMLEERGARPLAPLAVHLRPGREGMEKTRQRLLPGYVFFEQENVPDWAGIGRHSAVLRVLHYQDEQPELKGADLAFDQDRLRQRPPGGHGGTGAEGQQGPPSGPGRRWGRRESVPRHVVFH